MMAFLWLMADFAFTLALLCLESIYDFDLSFTQVLFKLLALMSETLLQALYSASSMQFQYPSFQNLALKSLVLIC